MTKGKDQANNQRGAKGGGAPKPVRASAHLQYLRNLIEAGSLLPDAIRSAAQFCQNLVESDEASERDRNNAAKTLATIANMNVNVALGLDKVDRLDNGDADTRTEIVVRYTNRKPNENADG